MEEHRENGQTIHSLRLKYSIERNILLKIEIFGAMGNAVK
jgi:hypothetical protein